MPNFDGITMKECLTSLEITVSWLNGQNINHKSHLVWENRKMQSFDVEFRNRKEKTNGVEKVRSKKIKAKIKI